MSAALTPRDYVSDQIIYTASASTRRSRGYVNEQAGGIISSGEDPRVTRRRLPERLSSDLSDGFHILLRISSHGNLETLETTKRNRKRLKRSEALILMRSTTGLRG